MGTPPSPRFSFLGSCCKRFPPWTKLWNQDQWTRWTGFTHQPFATGADLSWNFCITQHHPTSPTPTNLNFHRQFLQLTAWTMQTQGVSHHRSMGQVVKETLYTPGVQDTLVWLMNYQLRLKIMPAQFHSRIQRNSSEESRRRANVQRLWIQTLQMVSHRFR